MKSLHPTVLENMDLFSPSQMALNAPLMDGSWCDIKRHIWWGCEGHSAQYSHFSLNRFKEWQCWQAVSYLTAHLTPTQSAWRAKPGSAGLPWFGFTHLLKMNLINVEDVALLSNPTCIMCFSFILTWKRPQITTPNSLCSIQTLGKSLILFTVTALLL